VLTESCMTALRSPYKTSPPALHPTVLDATSIVWPPETPRYGRHQRQRIERQRYTVTHRSAMTAQSAAAIDPSYASASNQIPIAHRYR
jgi:hypothetical protein